MAMCTPLFTYMSASRKEGRHQASQPARVDRFEVESRYISVARLSQALYEGVEPTV